MTNEQKNADTVRPDEGGSGGASSTPDAARDPVAINRDEPTSRDVRLIARMLERKDWQIPDAAYRTLPAAMLRIAMNLGKDGTPGKGGFSERAQIAAVRCITSMNRQNQDNHPLPQQHEHVMLSGLERAAAEFQAMTDAELAVWADAADKIEKMKEATPDDEGSAGA